jgi:DNA helicase-2/ATP-dependent DNA helicase PcrA
VTEEQTDMASGSAPAPGPPLAAGDGVSNDPELSRIVAEEESCLLRVLTHLRRRSERRPERAVVDYDEQLISLRDQIATARLEDVPPLVEQMERLQSLAARRREVTEAWVDVRSPYFGRIVLEERGRRREVLIGRSTYLDTEDGIRIVDWRDAPVSRLFYRYAEGEPYDEVFGEREISGVVITRRTVTISDGVLRRIGAPEGTFVRGASGTWRRLDVRSAKLRGGQGVAARAEHHHRPGQLGVGDDSLSDDKYLKEITALIDPRQFELITRPDSGLVVIQGGAGSGKTTIGLHRLAYLAYQDARRFRPDRMVVIVFNDALARYVSQVLPALGVDGVGIRTYETWAERLRAGHFPLLPRRYTDETPAVVTRVKKHPAMLHAIDDYVAALAGRIESELDAALGGADGAEVLLGGFQKSAARPLAHRLHSVSTMLEGAAGRRLSTDARVAVERVLRGGVRRARDVISAWAELATDRSALGKAFARHAPGEISTADIDRAVAWCALRVSDVLAEVERRQESDEALALRGDKKRRASEPPRARSRDRDDDSGEEHLPTHGVDGLEVERPAELDREDDTLLLRLHQRLRGPLLRGAKGKEPLIYEHVLVDEAQDLSPVEHAVVLDTLSNAQSVTLAGDTAQRLLLDNGFSDWKTVLAELGLSHVEIEPLRLSYRSTQQIVDFARNVLGPLAPAEPAVAIREGAPVELFGFAHSGEAVAFLAEALRELSQAEPRASVAVVARYPEQADLYFAGLEQAEVSHLRRVADQDFAFKPGVDVTDVRQVKGLEFDYVVLVEASDAAYPADDEARHLLHIGATRAAHQLWILATGRPSSLLPEELRQRSG